MTRLGTESDNSCSSDNRVDKGKRERESSVCVVVVAVVVVVEVSSSPEQLNVVAVLMRDDHNPYPTDHDHYHSSSSCFVFLSLSSDTPKQQNERMMEKQPQQHCSGVDQPFAVTAATVEPTSRLPDGWTRCHAYLAHKKRYCRQQPVVVVVVPTNDDTNNHDSKVHSRYCGNHLHLFSLDASPVHHHKHHHKHHHSSSSSSSSSSRIPCPVDPSHWIAAHRVASHIRVCPATKKRYAQTQPDFIRVAMNAGGHGCVSAGDRHDTDNTEDNTEDNDNKTIRRPNQLSWDAQKRLALRVLTVYQRLFSSEPVSQSTSTSSLSSSFSNKNVTIILVLLVWYGQR